MTHEYVAGAWDKRGLEFDIYMRADSRRWLLATTQRWGTGLVWTWVRRGRSATSWGSRRPRWTAGCLRHR